MKNNFASTSYPIYLNNFREYFIVKNGERNNVVFAKAEIKASQTKPQLYIM
jgi:hypothetical protein